jgi:hypothetical protein
LLKSTLDSLVLALVQVADELFDGLPRGIKVFASFNELFPLLGEVGVLFEGLFVDVLVFL